MCNRLYSTVENPQQLTTINNNNNDDVFITSKLFNGIDSNNFMNTFNALSKAESPCNFITPKLTKLPHNVVHSILKHINTTISL